MGHEDREVTRVVNAAMETSPVATRPHPQANVDVEVHRVQAEVQGAIMLAKRFRRVEMDCLDRILTACQRPSLAEQSLYSYARGGTEITGPSIRLAEAIAQNWQNLQFGIKELEQRDGESTVEAFCWDMETNVRQVKSFQVKHERHTKSRGSYRLEDPRDIYEAIANQGARRLRACILGIIPGDVVDAAVSQCEQTMKAKADTGPEALKKILEAFELFKVSKDMIEKRIQRRFDTITPAQLVNLRKVYTSMKDGMSSAADWFDITIATQVETGMAPAEKGKAAKTLKDKVKDKVAPTDTPLVKEMAPGPCPNNPANTYTKQFCDGCPERKGCPTWMK